MFLNVFPLPVQLNLNFYRHDEARFGRTTGRVGKAGYQSPPFPQNINSSRSYNCCGYLKAHAFSSNAKGKILIIGGGAAGISMAARLMHWLDSPDITLIDPSDRQFYQPGFTLIASGVYKPDEVWKKQEDCIPDGVKWIKDSVAAVDPVMNLVTTNNNGKVAYDF